MPIPFRIYHDPAFTLEVRRIADGLQRIAVAVEKLSSIDEVLDEHLEGVRAATNEFRQQQGDLKRVVDAASSTTPNADLKRKG